MGRIAAPFGVRGWVKLKTYTHEPCGLAQFSLWWLEDGPDWSECEVEATALRGATLTAKLKGVSDRESAARLSGKLIAVPRDAMPEPEAETFYWADLIGLTVINSGGAVLGKIAGLLETRANNVLVVEGERRRLIPLVDEIVTKVDLAQGTVTVDWDPDY